MRQPLPLAMLAITGALLLTGVARAADTSDFSAGFQPEKLKDCRVSHGFKLLDNPKMVAAGEAGFLKDADYVLALTVNGSSRAYPTGFMGWHHGVNDRVGDRPFAVTFCNVCDTGIGFDLRPETAGGKDRALDFYGLYNGVVVLMDRETGSILLQAEGKFIKGPLKDKRLPRVAVLETTWGQWKKLHPDTVVMSPDTPYKQFYRGGVKPEMRERDRLSPFFIETITHGDLRLTPMERVLGVPLTTGEITGSTPFRAYPFKALKQAGGALNDTYNGFTVVAFLDPATEASTAFSRKLEGKTLTFGVRKDAEGKVTFYDQETGSQWTVEGVAESGPLAGKKLTSLLANVSRWYGWSAYFPQTSVFGTADGPKPGNPFGPAPTAPAVPGAKPKG